MKKIILFAFILLAIAQWIVPAKMLWSHDSVLKKGKVYKFQTLPVDPADPFKGRYVALGFRENSIKVNYPHNLSHGQQVYITLDTNIYGYAKIKHLRVKPPAQTSDYFQATVNYITSSDTTALIMLSYPFEEYYMQEFKAPKAEALYRGAAMNPQKTYAVVRIYNGNSIIEKLYINDKPVEELIK